MSKLNPYLLVSTSAMALVSHSASAKLWFLPDYQENISVGVASKPNVPNNCASFNGDGSGRNYVQNPDFSVQTCSGPLSMANKVKCYYNCSCKAAVSVPNGWKCDQYCDGKCVERSCAEGYKLSGSNCVCSSTCTDKVSSKPSNSSYTYESCTSCGTTTSIKSGWTCNDGYTKSGSSCICSTGCSDKVTTKPANSTYTYESCTACGTSISIKSGWSCNSGYSKSGSNCVANCTPNAAKTESQCSYGLVDCSDGCGGTTKCCKGCTPNTAKTESQCSYGLSDCADGCGGTTKCCKSCTPKAAASGCSNGTESCSDGCGGTTTCCKGCTPKAAETGCSYGTESCSDGCGSTTTCCKACSLPTCTDKVTSKPANSNYTTQSCTDCSGTKTINTGWNCDTGYTISGNSCVKNTVTCTNLWQKPNADSTECIDKVCEDYGSAYHTKPPTDYFCESFVTVYDGVPSDSSSVSLSSSPEYTHSITCVSDCRPTPKTCKEWNSSYYDSDQSDMLCTKRQAYELACYTCRSYSCEDGGYSDPSSLSASANSASESIPANCSEVNYKGFTCWQCTTPPDPEKCSKYSGYTGTLPECKSCKSEKPDPTNQPNLYCYNLSTCVNSTGGGRSCSTGCKKTNSCDQCIECNLTAAQCIKKYGKHHFEQGGPTSSTCWTWYTSCPGAEYRKGGDPECGNC